LLLGACGSADSERIWIGRNAGEAGRGRVAMQQYACHSCHTIPGVIGADKVTCPPLSGIASRMYIAGALPNTPENMLRWIEHPQQVDPLTAMPDMRVKERDALDMVAYLYTLK
jgi:cytochrome c2